MPGGVRTDEKGNLYIAGKGLFIYGPDGKPLHTLELRTPASNCGFGEVDGRTLFITAGSEIHRARLDGTVVAALHGGVAHRGDASQRAGEIALQFVADRV